MSRIRIAALAGAPILALAGVLAGTPAALPVAATAAEADTGATTCVGTQTATFSPGLTLVPTMQTVHVEFHYAPCTTTTGAGVTSGERSGSAQLPLSCLTAFSPTNGSVSTVHWNTGQSSVFSYNSTANVVAGNTVTTITGTVTSGLFAGATMTEIITGPTLNALDCAFSSFKRRDAAVVLTLTGG